MPFFPTLPDVPANQRTTGTGHLRYEDICQDGRVMLSALSHFTGRVVWRQLLATQVISKSLAASGVAPILTRVMAVGDDARVAVGVPLEIDGGYWLAHTRAADGSVDRILLNMWIEAHGTSGRTHGPPPPDAGARVRVGRVFAEHVFTRPFAPRGQRRVTALDVDGLPAVPERACDWRPLDQTAQVPEGAHVIDPSPVVDPTPIVFGLNHTDSNQHVNSLVYPRMFEEAALRRFANLGKSTIRLARSCEIAYRKPCFAGQHMRIAVQAFEHDGLLGAAGFFVAAADAVRGGAGLGEVKPHCFARMLFSE